MGVNASLQSLCLKMLKSPLLVAKLHYAKFKPLEIEMADAKLEILSPEIGERISLNFGR